MEGPMIDSFKILAGCLLMAGLALQARTRVTIHPLDFQIDDLSESHLQQILQLETNGERLFIRSENSYILEFDRHGEIHGTISATHFGTQADHSIAAFAIKGNQQAILNAKQTVYLFEDGAFQSYFPANLAWSPHP